MDRVRSLIDLLYQLPGQLGAWRVFVETLRHEFDGITAVCSYGGPGGTGAFSAVGDTDAIAAFTNHYGMTCPWNYSWFAAARAGDVGTDQMMLPATELMKSEFYNDWQRPHHHRHMVAGVVAKEGIAMSTGLAVWRSSRAGFIDRHQEMMRILIPHTQRVLQIHERLGGLRSASAAARDAVEILPYGVVLLDAQGCVLDLNAEARRIVSSRDGLSIDRKQLRASTPKTTERFRRLIASALATGRITRAEPGGVMACPRPSLHHPYAILVTPLGRSQRAAFGNRPAAAVFITDPEGQPRGKADALRHVFGLTAREACLTSPLSEGHSIDAIAGILTMSRETARVHLKHVYVKTGVKRQAALVRLVLATTKTVTGV